MCRELEKMELSSNHMQFPLSEIPNLFQLWKQKTPQNLSCIQEMAVLCTELEKLQLPSNHMHFSVAYRGLQSFVRS